MDTGVGSGQPFGQWLRRRRKALDMTQEQLADRIGCAESTIRMIENGARRPSRQIAALLADQLGVPVDRRETFLSWAREPQNPVKDAGGGSTETLQGESRPGVSTNLRPEPTRLLGRSQEVAAVVARLLQGSVRLLTLTGSPGVGKTRLALAVAEKSVEVTETALAPNHVEVAGRAGPAGVSSGFADGVFFVGLATVSEPRFVAPAVARSLGIQESAEPALEVLKTHLQGKTVLLLLDNFEQVLEAAPMLVELMQGCPGVTFLVTSREPLHLRGEQQFEVTPLSWPGKGERYSPASVLEYPAVALFVERAQAVDASFHLSEENMDAVVTVCAHLDGLPLAIELVAARVKLLPPGALVQRFNATDAHVSLQLASGGARDLPQRHRTLRDAIGWSYDLLSHVERLLFVRLGVFAGSYTLASVDAVCNARGDLEAEPLDLLASLLDKSLIKREAVEADSGNAGGPEPRYTMLEMVRAYTAERLEERGEAEKVRNWFLEYYLALAEAARPNLSGADQRVWLQRLDAEESNLRSAVRWALDSEKPEVAARIGVALHNYWYTRGKITEGRSWMDEIASRAETANLPARVQVELSNMAGFLATIQFDFASALRYLGKSVALARNIGEDTLYGVALVNLSGLETYRGNFARSEELLNEALAVFRATNDNRRLGLVLHGLAIVAYSIGDHVKTQELAMEAVSLLREAGDKWHTSYALSYLGNALCGSGQLGEAERACDEALAAVEGLQGNNGAVGFAINCKAYVAEARGNREFAKELYCDSLREIRALGNAAAPAISMDLLALSRLALGDGKAERATVLLAGFNALLERLKRQPAPVTRPGFEHVFAETKALLEEAQWQAAWTRGRRMSLDEIVALALGEE